MTKQEFIQAHKEFCDKMHELVVRKNNDYSGGSDPFKNVSMCETLEFCTTEQGIGVRMSDKISRIASYLNKGTLEVKDEGIIDSLIDLGNYSLILAIYLKDKTNE